MDVEITEKHFSECGVYADPQNCVLATALKDIGHRGISVGGHGLHIGNDYFRFDSDLIHEIYSGDVPLPTTITLTRVPSNWWIFNINIVMDQDPGDL